MLAPLLFTLLTLHFLPFLLSLCLFFVLTYDLPPPLLLLTTNKEDGLFFPSDMSPSICYIFSRPKKLTLKGYKQYWCTFKDITISCYKSKEESHGTPAHQMNLRGADTKKLSFHAHIRMLCFIFLGRICQVWV